MKIFNFWNQSRIQNQLVRLLFIVFIAISLTYVYFVITRVSPTFFIDTDLSFLERESRLKKFIEKLYPNNSKSADIAKMIRQQAVLISDAFGQISWHIPTNILRGFFYYILKDNFIVYFIKKSSFWENEGKYLDETEKKELVEKIKYTIKRLFEENQKYPESDSADIAKYSDQTKIVVTKQSSSPSGASSTSKVNPSKKWWTWYNFFKRTKLFFMKVYLVIKNFFKKYISQIAFFFKYKLFSTISLKKKFFFNFITNIFTKFIFFSTNNFNSVLNKVVFIKKKINNIISNFTIKQFFNKNNFIKYFIIIFIITISFFILYIFYIVSPEIVIRYPFTDAGTLVFDIMFKYIVTRSVLILMYLVEYMERLFDLVR